MKGNNQGIHKSKAKME